MQYRIREYGSEYDWLANEAFLLPPGQRQPAFETAQKFRSGRDALKAVAAACKDRYEGVLLPALCCESMVSPFTMHDIKPSFYRLMPDYTADIEDVKSKLTDNTIFLYGSYFGKDPFEPETLRQLRNTHTNVLFLEDRTQDLLCPEEKGFLPDVTIASVRKWTAIGDGGLLWSAEKAFSPCRQDLEFSRIRTEAMLLKSEYLQSGDEEKKTVYREMLGAASDMLDASADAFVMAEESAKLLEQLDIEKIYAKRQENAHTLQMALAGAKNLQQIVLAPEKSTLYFPVLVRDQHAVQTALAKQGIYCPVLWPVPREALGVCPVAEYTAEHMLGIPCDHRYSVEDMQYIAGQIVRAVDEK